MLFFFFKPIRPNAKKGKNAKITKMVTQNKINLKSNKKINPVDLTIS